MKSKIFFSLAFFFVCNLISAQNAAVGIWKNLDDEDGKEKSHIQITELNGVLTAKVIKLLPAATLRTCAKCKGDQKNKPIEGMNIVWGMKPEGKNKWTGGEILNPKNGKVYSCNMELEDKNTLKVRGYLGMPTIGKTQVWYRVN